MNDVGKRDLFFVLFVWGSLLGLALSGHDFLDCVLKALVFVPRLLFFVMGLVPFSFIPVFDLVEFCFLFSWIVGFSVYCLSDLYFSVGSGSFQSSLSDFGGGV